MVPPAVRAKSVKSTPVTGSENVTVSVFTIDRCTALLEKQTANLRRYHPKLQMWMSPQG